VRFSIDEKSLQLSLREENLTLIHAEVVGQFSWVNIWKKLSSIGTVKTQDKIVFYRNMGAMVEAGLALSRTLMILERQASNPKMKKIIGAINDKVKKGSSLSIAMSEYKEIFSPLVISMVQAGEESGNLVQALGVVADQLDKSHTLNKKIRGALIYPGVIMSAMAIIGVFMMIYVVPTLTKTFGELSVELPASTQFIIGLSNFVQTNLIFSLILIAGVLVGIYLASKSRLGRKGIHWFVLKIPVIGKIVIEVNSARTTRTLASLLNAGVPFVRALQITNEVVQNVFYKNIIAEAEKSVQLGLPMSKVFKGAEKLYPPFVSEMMAVGEETGEMGGMLLKVAIFYENEVDQKTKNMSTIIEPILMVVVGIAVGFFAISMISPMYSLMDNI
jgi:type IV pilus assembly protein PilC